MPRPTRKRRILSFSLRTLLVALTFACVLLGWRLHYYQARIDALKALDAAHPNPQNSFGRAYTVSLPKTYHLGWIATLAIVDRNYDYSKYIAAGAGAQSFAGYFSDADARWIADFPETLMINLCGPGLTDNGLRHLRCMKRLKQLTLGGSYGYVIGAQSNVSDEGMRHLSGIRTLERLHLIAPRIGDAGVRYFSALQNLKELGLNGTKIADAGVRCISAIQNIEDSDLSGTKITDACGPDIALLSKLKHLELRDTSFGDAGVRALAKLARLETLGLGGTKATPASVDAILKLPKSCVISVPFQYTPEIDERICAARPDLKIGWAQNPEDDDEFP